MAFFWMQLWALGFALPTWVLYATEARSRALFLRSALQGESRALSSQAVAEAKLGWPCVARPLPPRRHAASSGGWALSRIASAAGEAVPHLVAALVGWEALSALWQLCGAAAVRWDAAGGMQLGGPTL